MKEGEPSTRNPEPRIGLPVIRSRPEDFVVEEIPLYAPTGEGGHTFVCIEKTLRTTEEVAKMLAAATGVRSRDVGYAGRKDRAAVTRQWFSLEGVSPDAALSLELDRARVLEAIAHPHKLRTGQLRGNRFEILVRGVDEGLEQRARSALRTLTAQGMPNRFGAQRFGRSGDNAQKARRVLAGASRRMDRREARFLLSALQSEVFNRVLEERPLPMDVVEQGDVAQVTESGGLFVVEDVETENERAARFEISPTGPIFGTKMKQPEGAVALREESVLRAMELPAMGQLKPPAGIRLRGARRALRVRPADASLEREADGLWLRCTLGSGSYVTVLLEELFGALADRAV